LSTCTLDDPLQVATMRQMRLTELLATQSRAADWQAFVECSPLPLAHSDADLNTFMSIFEQVCASISDCVYSSNSHRLAPNIMRVSTISNTFFVRDARNRRVTWSMRSKRRKRAKTLFTSSTMYVFVLLICLHVRLVMRLSPSRCVHVLSSHVLV
jgi:hypothetical protein